MEHHDWMELIGHAWVCTTSIPRGFWKGFGLWSLFFNVIVIAALGQNLIFCTILKKFIAT